jgi:putative transposase
MNTIYPSDLSDDEWKHLQQYLPSEPSRGRPRTHTLRAICNAIFYVLRTGCPWRYLPSNFLPWQTVFYHFRRWRLKGSWYRLFTALRAAERERVGRNAEPSAAIIDAQSVMIVEESAGISGFDAHKHVKGRKRHLLVDTLELLLAVYVTPADMHDTLGARRLLAGLAPLVPRLKKIWADGASARAGVGQVVQRRGGLGPRSGEAHTGRARLQRSASAAGGRAFVWLAFSQ